MRKLRTVKETIEELKSLRKNRVFDLNIVLKLALMGEIYLWLDTSLNENAIIKLFVSNQVKNNEDLTKNFLSECFESKISNPIIMTDSEGWTIKANSLKGRSLWYRPNKEWLQKIAEHPQKPIRHFCDPRVGNKGLLLITKINILPEDLLISCQDFNKLFNLQTMPDDCYNAYRDYIEQQLVGDKDSNANAVEILKRFSKPEPTDFFTYGELIERWRKNNWPESEMLKACALNKIGAYIYNPPPKPQSYCLKLSGLPIQEDNSYVYRYENYDRILNTEENWPHEPYGIHRLMNQKFIEVSSDDLINRRISLQSILFEQYTGIKNKSRKLKIELQEVKFLRSEVEAYEQHIKNEKNIQIKSPDLNQNKQSLKTQDRYFPHHTLFKEVFDGITEKDGGIAASAEKVWDYLRDNIQKPHIKRIIESVDKWGEGSTAKIRYQIDTIKKELRRDSFSKIISKFRNPKQK